MIHYSFLQVFEPISVSAWCVEDEFGFRRENTPGVASFRTIVVVGTALVETERDLETNRTGEGLLHEVFATSRNLFGPIGRSYSSVN